MLNLVRNESNTQFWNTSAYSLREGVFLKISQRRLCYAARGHVFKLCIFIKSGWEGGGQVVWSTASQDRGFGFGFFCLHSVALGSTQRWVPGYFLGSKVQPACRCDNSAVLVGPNVKAKMKFQNSFPPLSLHDLPLMLSTSCSLTEDKTIALSKVSTTQIAI